MYHCFFRRHVCLSNLKHAPSRELPLTARKTVFSHLNLHPYLAVADPDLQIRGWGWSSRPRDKGVGRVGGGLKKCTLGTRGFSRVRWEFSVLAEGRYIFGRGLKPRAANWQKPETALEKSLAPRVQKMFLWSFVGRPPRPLPWIRHSLGSITSRS